MTKITKPVFSHDGGDVKAGGCLLYKFNKDNELYILLMKSREKFEDLGGTTDTKDKTILDTISREVYEESNKLISKESIKARIEKLTPIYIKTSKYLLYILEATEEEAKLKSELFGKLELHDNIKRTVHWMKYNRIKDEDYQEKLNFRLKYYPVFNKLKSVYNTRNSTRIIELE
jgi:hypothetical protein